MATVNDVNSYIEQNIFHSELWESLDLTKRNKVVNNCLNILTTTFPDLYSSANDVPVNILATQILWFLRVDDSIMRSELGVTYIQIDGVGININQQNNTIAPYVYDLLGKPRRRVGRYTSREIGTPYSIYREED
ncbi:hypothetical protein [Clostridium felsineum]|uniref:hypothetical protein n=1 Tax=Clostridium felsineum TaxID=36839 RepID=UPI00098CEA2D|nr:hypothetical protein [Clostridium felsineum]URZ16864.1 hypothetical protein CLFE_029110 [Clostridium felsineum DSM 794]